ncbi:MAG: alpha/beta hydrolase [Acidobacteriaceae bacterium]|nr:alpha/beta hydrolase [Acidobacteriaceae bacterium]
MLRWVRRAHPRAAVRTWVGHAEIADSPKDLTAPSPQIHSVFIAGPAGRLEALHNVGSPDATHAALVCHPHPLFGGTMHNKIVFNAMKALHSFGFPVLRFNFRGTGRSEGKHDNGRGEQDDVRGALDWLDEQYHLPVIFAGVSFGAVTGLSACCSDERVAALIGIAMPVAAAGRLYRLQFLEECTKPKLFISGSNDEFAPRFELEKIFARAAEPKRLVFIEGSKHLFDGRVAEVRTAIEEWIPTAL